MERVHEQSQRPAVVGLYFERSAEIGKIRLDSSTVVHSADFRYSVAVVGIAAGVYVENKFAVAVPCGITEEAMPAERRIGVQAVAFTIDIQRLLDIALIHSP